jgi:transcriptional regulator with XRE-family HTH domain
MPKPKKKTVPSRGVTPREAKHTLSKQLREIIDSRGLTAYAVGQESGVDPTVIGRFLADERDIRLGTADKIAAALGLRLVEVAKPKGRGRPAKPTTQG